MLIHERFSYQNKKNTGNCYRYTCSVTYTLWQGCVVQIPCTECTQEDPRPVRHRTRGIHRSGKSYFFIRIIPDWKQKCYSYLYLLGIQIVYLDPDPGFWPKASEEINSFKKDLFLKQLKIMTPEEIVSE